MGSTVHDKPHCHVQEEGQQQGGGGGKKKGGKKGRTGPSGGLTGQAAEGLKALLGQREPKAAKQPKVVKF